MLQSRSGISNPLKFLPSKTSRNGFWPNSVDGITGEGERRGAVGALPQGRSALVAGSGSCGSAPHLLTASPSQPGASQESHLLLADLPLPKWIPISQLPPSS